MPRLLSSLVLLLISLCVPAQAAEPPPHVVVSIAPVHSLIAGVMEGVAEPELLLTGQNSPHSYQLKPSQVKTLHRADVVVWVGANMESFLPKSLATLEKQTKVITLMDLPGMKVLPAREGGIWETAVEHHEGDHGHAEKDGHLWLDPDNARVIVEQMVIYLSQLDAAHAAAYRANGARLQQQLLELDRSLQQLLAPVQQMPYLVFHDAYQYFEQHFGLNPVGAIMVDPEHKPGARRLMEIRARVKNQNARCVFREPQFSGKLLQVVTEGAQVKSAALDPMGMGLEPGKGLYFDLMLGLGQGLVGCLAAK